ncbi:MAG: sporulation protein [Tindallia sp. MSAO_Bac2]|nr:MAG: sporulation protein [Tindallia sp. MSAO_Bac2]
MSMNLNENMSVMFEKLEKFFTSKTVVGEAVQVADVTIIPLLNISFGLGLGGGDGVDEKGNKGVGSGSGLGAKAVPTAVLVVKGGDVQVLSINQRSGLEKLVDLVPDILEKVDFPHCCEGEEKEASDTNQE